jgi:hypothetical protein
MPVIRALDPNLTVNEKALARVTEKLPAKSIEESLDQYNAGITDVARVVGDVLNFGANESTKLRAAQLAIEFRNLGAKKNDNRIVFNLLGNNITLNNLIVQE